MSNALMHKTAGGNPDGLFAFTESTSERAAEDALHVNDINCAWISVQLVIEAMTVVTL